MAFVTREQARVPQRKTETLTIEEFDAPLRVAKPSASLTLYLREARADFASTEAITRMVADMLVDETGAYLVPLEAAPDFLKGISSESLTALVLKCLSLVNASSGGAPGNPKPSTSA
jgi:hypothetical protein